MRSKLYKLTRGWTLYIIHNSRRSLLTLALTSDLLTPILIGGRGLVTYYPHGKVGDRIVSVVLVLSRGQTDTQTPLNALLPPRSSARVTTLHLLMNEPRGYIRQTPKL